MTFCRAFLVAGRTKPEEVVQATLSSLPDEVIDSVGVTALGSEDSLSERRRKLEFLQQQEELIKVLLLFSTYASHEGLMIL
jgi:LETM1 and EF-hand domain-containing protein 1